MGAIRAALSESAMSGEIPIGGVLDILRDIESRRITGQICFTAGGETGEVDIIGGQIALDQEPRRDGSDPVEALLALRGGTFVVHQRLPPLPVSVGDDGHRTGSLAVHVPADLMNYCEQAGLTGTLQLRREGELVELVYESGELLAIRIDGREGADLSHVFGWDEGRFEIRVGRDVRSLVPDGVPSRASEDDAAEREPTTQFVRPKASDDTGKHFLKVFEVALTDIVATREKARPAARTSPPRAPIASVRPPALSSPKRKREPTVRIVYLAGDDESALAAIDHATRYASTGSSQEEVVIGRVGDPAPKAKKAVEAAPKVEKTAEAPKTAPSKPQKTAPKAQKSPNVVVEPEEPVEASEPEAASTSVVVGSRGGTALAWWVAVAALVLVLLVMLAELFPPAGP